MRYYLTNLFVFTLLLISCTTYAKLTSKGVTMKQDDLLTISVYCENNTKCIYSGEKELFIEIIILNNAKEDIFLPLEYIKKTGPSIKLVDNKTGKSTQLRTNLADRELLKSLIKIPAGETVSIEWVIFKTELEQFGSENLDVSAEFSILTNVYLKNKLFHINKSAILQIKGKNSH